MKWPFLFDPLSLYHKHPMPFLIYLFTPHSLQDFSSLTRGSNPDYSSPSAKTYTGPPANSPLCFSDLALSSSKVHGPGEYFPHWPFLDPLGPSELPRRSCLGYFSAWFLLFYRDSPILLEAGSTTGVCVRPARTCCEKHSH